MVKGKNKMTKEQWQTLLSDLAQDMRAHSIESANLLARVRSLETLIKAEIKHENSHALD